MNNRLWNPGTHYAGSASVLPGDWLDIRLVGKKLDPTDSARCYYKIGQPLITEE
jgi:hypothetical protein